MEVKDLVHAPEEDKTILRLNKATRAELDVKVGDKVKITRVTKETIEAEVHQAKKDEIEVIKLEADDFIETDPTYTIEKVIASETPEAETEDDEDEDLEDDDDYIDDED